MRFSRLACSIVVEGIREIIRCDAAKTGASEYADCGQLKDALKVILPE
jgi:hypothetical protein